MITFTEFYKNKLNEAAAASFEDFIEDNPKKWKSNAKSFSLEKLNSADEELIQEFLHAIEKDDFKVDTKSGEFKDLVLAIASLASSTKKEYTDKLAELGFEATEGEPLSKNPLLKKIKKQANSVSKKIISNIKSETPEPEEKPKETPTPEPEEKPEEKPTPEPEEKPKASAQPEGPRINPRKAVNPNEKPSDPSDEKSPAYFAKQAEDLLNGKIEDLQSKADSAKDDSKKAKINKVTTELAKTVRSKIAQINKQQGKYSYHSNFSTRLKATNNSKALYDEIKTAVELADNKAFVKGLDTGLERTGQTIKNAAGAVKAGIDKFNNNAKVSKAKEGIVRGAKVAGDAIKRGAKVAAPVVKRTTEKVVDKVKTESQDAIIRKYLPDQFEKFVNSDSADEKSKIYHKALIIKRQKDQEADKKRRIAKGRVNSQKAKESQPAYKDVIKPKVKMLPAPTKKDNNVRNVN